MGISYEIVLLLILIAIITALPLFIWFILFYKKNPVDKVLAIKTFLGGVLLILPYSVFMYYMSGTGNVEIDYKLLIGMFFSIKFFFWFAKNKEKFGYSFYLFLFSLIITLYFIYFDDKTGIILIQWQVRARSFEDFKNLFSGVNGFIGLGIYFFVLGGLEEYLKHWVVKEIDYSSKKFKTVRDGIEFNIIAALGFVFIENLLYFHTVYQLHGFGQEFLITFSFRSVFAVAIHCLCSGIYGYYFGLAKFAREQVVEEIGTGNSFILTRLIKKITGLNLEVVYKGEKVLEWLFWAMLLHGIFNLIIEIELIYLIIPYLLVIALVLKYQFNLKRSIIDCRIVEAELIEDKLNEEIKKEKS